MTETTWIDIPTADGFRRVSTTRRTAPAPAARDARATAACIPTCREARPHERWECELLATTPEEWARILA